MSLLTTDGAHGAPATSDDTEQLPTATTEDALGSSTMMRLLSRDVHAQLSVLRALDASDVGRLVCTCRTWRSWIEHPPAHLLAGLSIVHRSPGLTPSRLVTISTFARHRFSELLISDVDKTMRWTPLEKIAIDEALAMLPSFTRLAHISITLRHSFFTVENLRLCFTALSSTLNSATLTLNGNQADKLASDVLDVIGVLSRLDTLILNRDAEQPEIPAAQLTEIKFTQLAELPRLATFRMKINEWFTCSMEQVEVLARCKALSTLECGRWPVDPEDPRRAEYQLDIGLAALVRGQLKTMHELGLSVPTLTSLELGLTIVTSAIFDQLLQLPGLTSLWPGCFGEDTTMEQWARLSAFTQLRHLSVRTAKSQTGLNTELFLPFLPRSLTRISLFRVRLSEVQLSNLCALPVLSILRLHRVRIETLAPFATAKELTQLSLIDCADLDDQPLDPRDTLPPMPKLAILRVDDLIV